MQQELFKLLKSKYSERQAIEQIAFIGYLATLEKRLKINHSLDFYTREKFNEKALELSRKVESFFSGIIKDIIVSGIIDCGIETHAVYSTLIRMPYSDLVELITEKLFIPEEMSLRFSDSLSSYDVSKLVLSLFEDSSTKTVIDLCSGAGNFLVQAVKENHSVNVRGIELRNRSTILSKIRLSLLDANFMVSESNVLNCSMKREFDLVFSNYPWNMRLVHTPAEDQNPRMSTTDIKMKSDWAFVAKAINSFSAKGKAVILISDGCLFNKVDEKYRKEIIDKGLLEMVIALPSGTMPGTNVSYSMLVFSENNTTIKLIDASDSYRKNVRQKRLDVEAVMNIVSNRDKKYKEISTKDIVEEDYCLDVGRYFQKKIIIPNPIKLKEVASVFRGYSFNAKLNEELEPGQGECAILKLSDIEDGEINYNDLNSFNKDISKVERFLLKEGDIVLTSRGPTLKIAIIKDIADLKIVASASLMVIRPISDKINPYYLYLFLTSDIGNALIKRTQTGGIIMVISKSTLCDMEVPLIDCETQEVAENRYKILFQKLNEAKLQIKILESKISDIYSDLVGE